VQERLAELESRVETKTAAALHLATTELYALLERRVGALQADTERRLHTVHTEVRVGARGWPLLPLFACSALAAFLVKEVRAPLDTCDACE
jgi:hypothetical protein